MADITFAIAGGALGVLLGANAVLIVARITHREKIARFIVRAFSHVTWLFKLGGDSQP